jgi:AraC family transcriptional regulator
MAGNTERPSLRSSLSEAERLSPQELVQFSENGIDLIECEVEWRSPPRLPRAVWGNPVQVRLSRWRNAQLSGRTEVASETEDDSHVLTMVLRRSKQELFIGGRPVWNGGSKGEMLLTGPKSGKWSAVVEGAFDQLRVFLPQSLISECYTEAFGRPPPGDISLFEVSAVEDELLRHLAQTYKSMDGNRGIVGLCFADSVGLAFAHRLVRLFCSSKGSSSVPDTSRLAKARLARTIEYIEENLGESVTLADLSKIAGLSRIQFVRQFKSAMGDSPHSYVLRRRIERAKSMLEATDASIVGVALDLGFSSHGHFTQVFRKLVGVTPSHWQKSRSV